VGRSDREEPRRRPGFLAPEVVKRDVLPGVGLSTNGCSLLGMLNSDDARGRTRVPRGYVESLLRVDSLDGIGPARCADDLELLNRCREGLVSGK
jgi:hypothetical protein